MNHVIVVSDGTGGTARRALDAALTQFENIPIDIVIRPGVSSEEQIHKVIHEAAKIKALIVHTLVSNELRQMMVHLGRRHNIETIDLMGPLLDRLSEQLAVSPSEKPGLFKQLNESYFRRVETMEFAIQHDDGRRSEELEKAEIILCGVSRTFKTPLSVYLSFKGWFVANVPIIPDVEPPSILFSLPPGRIFGLTMHANRLTTLRQSRAEYLGNKVTDYIDLRQVRHELLYALRVFERIPSAPVIDVTGKPIEEIASEIITLKRKIQPEWITSEEEDAKDV